MPWTCPSCNAETQLGYNVCISCQTPRPGTASDAATRSIDIPITTTPSFATHEIDAYLGPVFGETIYGANVLRDFFAGIADLIGGRSSEYESLLARGRSAAMAEMASRAKELGANAVVGMRFDYSTVGNSMLMICCLGTAVTVNEHSEQ